jgi:hypothetical protein
MSLVDLKAAAEVIEIAYKCFAILGAGVWAVLLLVLLRQREQAQAGLTKTEAEVRNLELQARRQAVVRVDIQATVHRDPDGAGYVILATVDLTNQGTRNTRIKWRDEPPAFYIRKTEFGPDGRPEFAGVATEFRVPLTRMPDQEPISHLIRAGAMQSIPFAVRISSAGLYLLSFRGAVDEQEQKVSKEGGMGEEMPKSWTGSKYVLVT